MMTTLNAKSPVHGQAERFRFNFEPQAKDNLQFEVQKVEELLERLRNRLGGAREEVIDSVEMAGR
ncbi:MAG: hypothetical protein WC784_05250 [Candidatus Shapirobacteria bacterium]|jgi:hypothetical protein